MDREFPNEICEHIIKYLPVRDLLRYSEVSSTWKDLCDAELSTRNLICTPFPPHVGIPESRRRYRELRLYSGSFNEPQWFSFIRHAFTTVSRLTLHFNTLGIHRSILLLPSSNMVTWLSVELTDSSTVADRSALFFDLFLTFPKLESLRFELTRSDQLQLPRNHRAAYFARTHPAFINLEIKLPFFSWFDLRSSFLSISQVSSLTLDIAIEPLPVTIPSLRIFKLIARNYGLFGMQFARANPQLTLFEVCSFSYPNPDSDYFSADQYVTGTAIVHFRLCGTLHHIRRARNELIILPVFEGSFILEMTRNGLEYQMPQEVWRNENWLRPVLASRSSYASQR